MNESNDFFMFHPKFGCWATLFRKTIAYTSCATDIDPEKMTEKQMQIDKPIYLSVMARYEQLQPILDNPHLFDPMFVNAVRIVMQMYERVIIEEPPISENFINQQPSYNINNCK